MRKIIIKISVALGIVAIGITTIFLMNKYVIPNAQNPNTEETNKPTEVVPSETKPSEVVPSEDKSTEVIPSVEYVVDVNIIVSDIKGNAIYDDHIEGNNKTLFEILDENYELRYEKSATGTFLYDIGELKTDKWTTFIGIYVNDEFSQFGIDYIKLYDGIKIEFRETKVWNVA